MTPKTFTAIHNATGWTAEQLAVQLGMVADSRSIRRYRSGERNVPGPQVKLMELLAERYLGIGWRDLISDDASNS
jgi:transcriptional regulator with XRE-family HTH domain